MHVLGHKNNKVFWFKQEKIPFPLKKQAVFGFRVFPANNHRLQVSTTHPLGSADQILDINVSAVRLPDPIFFGLRLIRLDKRIDV